MTTMTTTNGPVEKTLELEAPAMPSSSNPTKTTLNTTDQAAARTKARQAKAGAAAGDYAKAMDAKEMDAKIQAQKDRGNVLAAGAIMNVKEPLGSARQSPWTVDQARGPPQVVTHVSKFVNKLSEITDDMNISGSLSIKYNAIGGSGRGSFLDAETFYDSDLNYYISVKVVNQTVNYKDALTFNPLRSCMSDQTRFNETFGDSFISGFLEGGELNAVVSIKIHNKSKRREIEAEAKVALTAGPVEISAQGNLKLAEENIALNAETNIYVSWSGGGNIKPYDDSWTMSSLTRAAARFPSLVARNPQRIYATLTKYETLRSYLLLKPVKLSPLRYENVQIYTSALLDAYMTYKTMSQRLEVEMNEIQAGSREFVQLSTDAVVRPVISPTGLLRKAGLDYFAASIYGLDQARRAIRRQMNLISREVDAVAADPTLGSSADRQQPYLSSMSMQMLLPATELVAERRRTGSNPLSSQRINATLDDKEIQVEQGSESRALCDVDLKSGLLTPNEAQKIAKLEEETWDIGSSYRMTPPVGSPVTQSTSSNSALSTMLLSNRS